MDPSLTDTNKVGAETGRVQPTPSGAEIFPADPANILNTPVTASADSESTYTISSKDIVGPDLIFSGKVNDKSTTAVVVKITAKDSNGASTCYIQATGSFGSCPDSTTSVTTITASIDAEGNWSVSIPKNVFSDALKYLVALVATDAAGASHAAMDFSFGWISSPGSPDASTPKVISVTSANQSGTVYIGQTISLQVVFSEPVTVVGIPQLTIAIGGINRIVDYVSGSGTNTLIFNYVVQAGDNCSTLDYAGSNALSTNGGSIKDAEGNSAATSLATPGQAGSLGANVHIAVDSISIAPFAIEGPALTNLATPNITWVAAANATKYDVTISANANCVPALQSFNDVALNYVSATALAAGTYYVCITAKDNNIRTLAASNNPFAFVIDMTAPAVAGVTSTTSNGSYKMGSIIDVVVNFSEAVTVAGTPTLQLESGATDQVISYVSGSGTASLVFSYIVQAGDSSAGLNYKATDSLGVSAGSIKDGAGNDALLTLPGLGTPQSLSGDKTIAIDGVTPAVLGITSNTANMTYGVGAVIDVRVSFSEIVNVVGTPNILLAVGGTNRTATYVSGSGTNVLVFSYNVQNDDYASDLTYASTSALTVSGGSILDAAGNGAILTLPDPTAAGSLAANKTIVINAITTSPGNFAITSVQPAGSGQLLVAWANASGPQLSYTVKYGTSTGSYTTTATPNATSPYLITGLANSTNYFVMVTAVNTAGSTNATAEQSAVVNSLAVNAGSNQSAGTLTTLTGTASGAASVLWTKQSGPGAVTFGSPTSLATTVSASVDGSYVLRLTGTNASGATTFSEMNLVWNSAPPIFTSIDLGPLAFGDGIIDRVEARSGNYLAANLAGSGYQDAGYLVASASQSCSSYPAGYFRPEIPMTSVTYGYSSGGYKVCVRLTSAYGVPTYGESADFTRDTSAPVTDPHTVKSVATSGDRTCAILNDNSLKCWGQNSFGELGIGDNVHRGVSPGDMAALPTVFLGAGRSAKSVVVGLGGHTCAILDNNTVRCWGNSSYGQTAGEGAVGPIQVNLGAGRTATSISAGDYHTCVILDNASLKCWGRNDNGSALGLDDTTNRGKVAGDMTALPTVNLGAGRTAKAVGAFVHSTCVILDNDLVKCWGNNGNGQLGLDTTNDKGRAPGEMAALPTVNLGAGRTAKALSRSCAILDNDTLKCWGTNASGELGLNDNANRGTSAGSMAALPTVNLGAGRTAKLVSGGASHTCAILDNNTLKCWGSNDSGELGADDMLPRGSATAAINVGAGRTVKSVSAGTNATCAILDNDALKCWGRNLFGTLGQDDRKARAASPTSMATLPAVNLGAGRSAKHLAAGTMNSCVILDNNLLKCWGYNEYGQLGLDHTLPLGTTSGDMAALTTVNLGVGRTVKSISLNYRHSCAILDNNSLKCWGSSGSGALGIEGQTIAGTSAGHMAALSTVVLGAGRTAKMAKVGSDFTCAILDNDSVKCWGDNTFGQLGKDDLTMRGLNTGDMSGLTPINLGAGRTAKAIDCGTKHVCAILDNDALKCWGSNASGSLGLDDVTNRGDDSGEMASLPTVNLGAGRTAKSIALGGYSTCAILDNDSLKCWGTNTVGELGLDDSTARGNSSNSMANLPTVDLGGGRKAKAITKTYASTCAILDNNTVKCWGYSDRIGTDSVVQWGRGSSGSAPSMANLPIIELGAGRTAKELAGGDKHTCVLLDDNTVKCWGESNFGQLGLDSTIMRGISLPVASAREIYFP